jgi:polyisoprenoid-binding protein YceI
MVTNARGAFIEFEDTAVVDARDFTRSNVMQTIKATSIDTRNEHRDGHLLSNDFLAMEKHSEITFVSTRLTRTGPTSLVLTGDLTIKGVTSSVTVPFELEGVAMDPFGSQRAGFEGSVTIHRHDYIMTWNTTLETGGVLVSEKIQLEFELSAIENA